MNYKWELLYFLTLEFLYKNREIINEQTNIFSLYFPLILKIFSTFPKFLNEKFFVLVEYMIKKSTVKEIFNYILDLPSVILLIENFECFFKVYRSNSYKICIDKFFHEEYVKIVKFLLRDESYDNSMFMTMNDNVPLLIPLTDIF